MDNWKSNRERERVTSKYFQNHLQFIGLYNNHYNSQKKNSITRYNARYYFYFEPAHGDERKFLLVISIKKKLLRKMYFASTVLILSF